MKEYLKQCGQPVVISCFLLLFLGCASVSMQSVKDPSFKDPVNKLFIVLNNGQVDTIDPVYTTFLVNALKEEFLKKGVEMEIHIINPLSLDESSYEKEISSYGPDGLLTIVSNGGILGEYGYMEKINYNVSLFDSSKKKRIWRAQMNTYVGAAGKETSMKTLAQNLVARMAQDKLISSEPRKKGQKI